MKDGKLLGDTLFTSTAAAHDTLNPALRERLAALRAVNVHGVGRKKYTKPLDLGDALMQRIQKGVEHPVLHTHPNTGRKCLYVNSGCMQAILDMLDPDSNTLLEQLYEHIARPELVYRHRWQPGDVVMRGNGCTQHRAVGDYELPLRQLLFRTVVKSTPVH